ncbi:hypothetical protein L903_18935 [Agrobacterium sp. JL28]|nr:hypothetical protein L903_18935 [Agrobacterium sp. JL28]
MLRPDDRYEMLRMKSGVYRMSALTRPRIRAKLWRMRSHPPKNFHADQAAKELR